MSTNRRRRLDVPAHQLPKGPHGRALCRWCQTEVPPRRQTFCSQECVDEWEIRANPARARALVYRRDHGVCALCGLDTDYLRQVGDEIGRAVEYRWQYHGPDATGHWTRLDDESERGIDRRAAAALDQLARAYFGRGWLWSRWRCGPFIERHVWEMDHILPVVEGGGECGLDNLRTLCIPCHRQVTRELLRRRAGAALIHPEPQLQPALFEGAA